MIGYIFNFIIVPFLQVNVLGFWFDVIDRGGPFLCHAMAYSPMWFVYKVSYGLKPSKWYTSSTAMQLSISCRKNVFLCFKNNQRVSLHMDWYVWKLLYTFFRHSQHKALDKKRCFTLMTITRLGNSFLPLLTHPYYVWTHALPTSLQPMALLLQLAISCFWTPERELSVLTNAELFLMFASYYFSPPFFLFFFFFFKKKKKLEIFNKPDVLCKAYNIFHSQWALCVCWIGSFFLTMETYSN